ncbi:MAG TPA: T9SS type A sorting domain-containing protein, partial [Saprospiraceae bacterium]|nr:T9SS type A sorting domain-containing protein [Saprospiraceae bacterium]
ILPDTYVDIRINNKKSTPVPTEDKLLAFPNPAKEYVNLHFNGRNTIKAYKMVDMFGNIVGQVANLDQQSVAINTKNYATGIYLLQVVTTQGVITKKINITAE